MKRTFILFCASLISLCVSGQTTTKDSGKINIPVFHAGGLVMSPVVLVGGANLPVSGTYSSSHYERAYQLGYHLGYMITPHFGLMTGICYASNATSLKKISPDATIKSTFTLNYIDVPIFARIITSKVNKVGIVIDGGINIGALIKANEKDEATLKIGGSLNRSIDIKNLVNTTSLSATGFIGIKIPVYPSINIMAGADFQRSLNNTFKEHTYGSHLSRIGAKVMIVIKLTGNYYHYKY